MSDENITNALLAIMRGHVRHRHPFTWECDEAARHVDPRTLQRALQQELISVQRNADRTSRPVTLTHAGLARLGRDAAWPQPEA